MKCKHHPKTDLETTETVEYVSTPWSDELQRVYHDVEYCPECFIEHESGAIWKHEIIHEPLFNNISKTIDKAIDAQIDERK